MLFHERFTFLACLHAASTLSSSERVTPPGLGADGAIQRPRERVTLDVLQRAQNLMTENCVLDLSQSLGRNAIRKDGLVPTLATACGRLFVPLQGTCLTANQRLALQGHNPADYEVEAFTPAELFRLAGNAMGVPVVGTVLAAAISQLQPAA